jgi:transposase
VAPSKLQRPLGDRIKTDARDAQHLARLLHWGQIAEVAIPSIEQEAARDLVRAPGGLPRRLDERAASDVVVIVAARDRLLRRHHVDGQARTVAKHAPIRHPGLQLAYEAAFDALPATRDRRDRLDRAIAEMAADSAFTPVVT